jgi:hypothetical protein
MHAYSRSVESPPAVASLRFGRMDLLPSQGALNTQQCRTLADLFASLTRLGQLGAVTHHPQRSLAHVRILLPPEEGEGYWEMARIGADVYVIVSNCTYLSSQEDFSPGDGLIYFTFRISGDAVIGVGSTAPLRWNSPCLLAHRRILAEGMQL